MAVTRADTDAGAYWSLTRTLRPGDRGNGRARGTAPTLAGGRLGLRPCLPVAGRAGSPDVPSAACGTGRRRLRRHRRRGAPGRAPGHSWRSGRPMVDGVSGVGGPERGALPRPDRLDRPV